jgi:glycosyltransferase involved in cell wall biosynthesis
MRAFICDPVCVLPFGHNAVAMSLFRRALAKHFDEVTALSCRYLPQHIVQKHGFEPFFDFYYDDYISLPAGTQRKPTPVPPTPAFPDRLEALATEDFRRLFEEFSIGAGDVLVFPSIDFYAGLGLLNVVEMLPAERRPRLLIRFIGVMENASKVYREPLLELVDRFREALAAGVDIAFSAEVPELAYTMSDHLEATVAITPYPDVHEALAMPLLGPARVYCPGSARHDKGFFSLLEIFAEVRRRDPRMDIRFVTQTVNPRDAVRNEAYISRLYAIPGLELLDSTITDEAMLEQFQLSTMVLLPYDRETYRLRGSAAMMEAVSFARPIVTLSGTAFAEQISWYRLGRVVDDVSQMADAVIEIAAQPREKLERRARTGRGRFITDVVHAYQDWLAVKS